MPGKSIRAEKRFCHLKRSIEGSGAARAEADASTSLLSYRDSAKRPFESFPDLLDVHASDALTLLVQLQSCRYVAQTDFPKHCRNIAMLGVRGARLRRLWRNKVEVTM